MKLYRAASLLLAAAAGTTAAFSGRSSAFVGRSVQQQQSSATATAFQQTTSRAVSSTSLTMIFEKLFGGGGGGAAGQKIVYDNLEKPGPELGAWAEAGKMPATSETFPNLSLATFAGGCFWGLELAYQRVPGVVYTAVGYTQGPEEFPNYAQVCSGGTGHTEAVVVYYDPTETTYEALLDTFFGRVNPTTVNGQGNDRGTQYRTGVYFHSPEQEAAATARFEAEQANYGKKPMASELKQATPFWPGEKYHQQYLEKGNQDASKGATDTIRCYG